MINCLLTSRGATRAQIMQRVLAGAGIPAKVVRPPREIAEEGCGYAVSVPQQLLKSAQRVLANSAAAPGRIYCEEGYGVYKEKGR